MFPVAHHDHGFLFFLADPVFFQHIPDHVILVHALFIQGRAADEFKVVCQMKIFQHALCGHLRLGSCHIEFESCVL